MVTVANVDKGFRCSAEHNAWLKARVAEAEAAGVVQLSEVARLIMDDWVKLTGRETSYDAMAQKVKKYGHFAKARKAESSVRVRRQFAEGSMIGVANKNTGVTSLHKDLDAALAMVDGAVNDYTFWECRPIRNRTGRGLSALADRGRPALSFRFSRFFY